MFVKIEKQFLLNISRTISPGMVKPCIWIDLIERKSPINFGMAEMWVGLVLLKVEKQFSLNILRTTSPRMVKRYMWTDLIKKKIPLILGYELNS